MQNAIVRLRTAFNCIIPSDGSSREVVVIKMEIQHLGEWPVFPEIEGGKVTMYCNEFAPPVKGAEE